MSEQHLIGLFLSFITTLVGEKLILEIPRSHSATELAKIPPPLPRKKINRSVSHAIIMQDRCSPTDVVCYRERH